MVVVRPVHLIFAFVVGAGAASAAAIASRPSVALQPEYPAHVTMTELPEPLEQHPFVGRAVPEKEAAYGQGPCDYPGPYVPCWCGTGPLAGIPVNCDSAADYLESVQEFGPPRGVLIGVRKEGMEVNITTE